MPTLSGQPAGGVFGSPLEAGTADVGMSRFGPLLTVWVCVLWMEKEAEGRERERERGGTTHAESHSNNLKKTRKNNQKISRWFKRWHDPRKSCIKTIFTNILCKCYVFFLECVRIFVGIDAHMEKPTPGTFRSTVRFDTHTHTKEHNSHKNRQHTNRHTGQTYTHCQTWG